MKYIAYQLFVSFSYIPSTFRSQPLFSCMQQQYNTLSAKSDKHLALTITLGQWTLTNHDVNLQISMLSPSMEMTTAKKILSEF